MFRYIFFLNFSFLIIFSPLEARRHAESAVTYSLSGGRLGDNLLAVAHAKWLSYTLGLPLIYVPFCYSDHLNLSADSAIKHLGSCRFSKEYYLYTKENFLHLWRRLYNQSNDTMLYVLPYHPETQQEFDHPNSFPLFTQVNWDDPVFLRELRSIISPRFSLRCQDLPSDRVTVAMHIRTDVGRDSSTWEEFTMRWPMKGPPFSYYVEALQLLNNVMHKPLYVYIFTDHPDPVELEKMFINRFSHLDIVFNSRKSGNRHDENVLEDFFAMGKFNCLIRSESNYSLMASKLFCYQIAIAPVHFERDSTNQVNIDTLSIQMSHSDDLPPIKTTIHRYNE
ncbi:MAG TPA: hypothetical protein VLE96_03255 [Chlamydiales bacterium]|nr:hypothetical protein [Chlamydiales bacterium]